MSGGMSINETYIDARGYVHSGGKIVGKHDEQKQQCIQYEEPAAEPKTAAKPAADPKAIVNAAALALKQITRPKAEKGLFASWLNGGDTVALAPALLPTACVGNEGTLPSDVLPPDGGINITPEPDAGADGDTEGVDGLTTVGDGEGRVLVMHENFMIDSLGERVQEGLYAIETARVSWDYPFSRDATVTILVESVPEKVIEHLAGKYPEYNFAERAEELIPIFAGLDGMIDVTQRTYFGPPGEEASQGLINIGTEENPFHIRDPRPAQNRLPVILSYYTEIDHTGKLESNLSETELAEICDPGCSAVRVDLTNADEVGSIDLTEEMCQEEEPEELVDKLCSVRLGAACSDDTNPCLEQTFKPYPVAVSSQAHSDGNFNYSLMASFMVDASNFSGEVEDPGTDVILPGRFRLIYEE